MNNLELEQALPHKRDWRFIAVGCSTLILALLGVIWIFTSVIHINVNYDPAKMATAIQGSLMSDHAMGPLPSDICLVEGKPVLLQAGVGDGYGYASVNLTYVDQAGNLVVKEWASGSNFFNSNPDRIYRWSGQLCPSGKAGGGQ